MESPFLIQNCLHGGALLKSVANPYLCLCIENAQWDVCHPCYRPAVPAPGHAPQSQESVTL